MHKPKFLKNSKDMLSRSFNSSKCKTSLRLAGSRLKLLKNKKEVQVKQMRREIAQLLESGQDQTARIRVEHVIREEKMMAAYELIELYCELIVARLSIIESQKNCPIDLKEAITSVLFASPRCGDVPELLDVRKHFTAKYGKEFATAAIELRPECGVGRMLVEKLSAGAPDIQTKVKILSAIAEEHNVKWDQELFEEKVSAPPSDLLSGPSTFGGQSKLTPGVQPSESNNNLHNSSSYYSQHNRQNSVGTEILTSPQTSNASTSFQPEASSPGGDRAQHLFQGDGPKRWNMEFKDATSAAQAAAESAEMASMAARAAAELASGGRVTRQYSTESHNSDSYISKTEGSEMYVNSRLASEQFSAESGNASPSERTRLKKEVKPNQLQKAGSRGKKEYNQSASLKSKSSMDGNSSDHNVPVMDGYSRKNSVKEESRGDISTKKESFKYNKAEEKSENVVEERRGKQPSAHSSRSHSSISDDVPSSHESDGVVFDNYDSDNGGYEFDTGPTYDDHEPEFHGPSSGRKSPEHLSVNTDYSSPRSSKQPTSPSPFLTTKNSSFEIPEKLTSTDGLEKDVHIPVIFDDSDGPSSEYEEEWNMSRPTAVDSSTDLRGKSTASKLKGKAGASDRSSLREQHSSRRNRKQSPHSSDDDLDPNEMRGSSGEGLDFQNLTGGLRHKGYNQLPSLKKGNVKTTAPSPVAESPRMKTTLDNTKTIRTPYNHSESDTDSTEEEKYPRKSSDYTGGVRHKGNNQPPSLKKGNVMTTGAISSSTAPSLVAESPRMKTTLDNKKSVRTPYNHSESDSDSTEEENYLRKSSSHTGGVRQPPSLQKGNVTTTAANSSSTAPSPVAESPRMKTTLDNKKSVRTPYNHSKSDSDSAQEEKYSRNSSDHTGGVRHKGYNQPPSLNKGNVTTTAATSSSTTPSVAENPRMKTTLDNKKSVRTPYNHSESDSDSTEEEKYSRKSSDHTGGVPHKGYNQPPSLKKGNVKTTAAISSSTAPSPASESPRMNTALDNKKSVRTPYHHPASDSDSSEEEYLRKSSARKQELDTRPTENKFKIKPTLRASNSVLDDDPPEDSLTRKSHLQNGISRRTKASPSTSRTSYSKTRLSSESLDFDDISESPKVLESQRSSGKLEKQPSSANVASKPAKSNYWGPPEPYNSLLAKSEPEIRPRHEKHDSDVNAGRKPTNTSQLGNSEKLTSPKLASNVTSSSSRVEKPSRVEPKTNASVNSSESPKPTALNKTNSNKEEKRASHVHPKLPDYDSLMQIFAKRS